MVLLNNSKSVYSFFGMNLSRIFLPTSMIVSPKARSENPRKSPSEPPMSPKREDDGYSSDSSSTWRSMSENPNVKPEVFDSLCKVLISYIKK